MTTTKDLIVKADTGLLANNSQGALLAPQKARKFMDAVFDDSTFLNKVGHEMRNSVTGTIEKIGIGKGLLQRKIEDTLPDLKNPFSFPSVPYTCKSVVSPMKISEDFFRQNLEGQSAEDRFMSMMKEQVQLDTLNVFFNGDEAISTSDEMYKTLSTDNGILKQLQGTKSEVKTNTLYPTFNNNIFNHAVRVLPRKYFNAGKYRWITSHLTYINWIEWLSLKQTTAGDMATITGTVLKPLGIDWEIVPDFPEDMILLADPKNFAIVNTYDMILRKTTEGMDAVLRDMRYYALHFDMDTIIFEKDACVLLNNVPSMVPTPNVEAVQVNMAAYNVQPPVAPTTPTEIVAPVVALEDNGEKAVDAEQMGIDAVPVNPTKSRSTKAKSPIEETENSAE